MNEYISSHFHFGMPYASLKTFLMALFYICLRYRKAETFGHVRSFIVKLIASLPAGQVHCGNRVLDFMYILEIYCTVFGQVFQKKLLPSFRNLPFTFI